nr:RING/FYVE/PHD zinc finger protein, putative [Ipomoea batatas]
MQIRALIFGAECCDVCGDIGCAEAIITCAKCRINQEHLYCMETFRMEAPVVWLCEECTPRNGNQSSCGKSGVTVTPNFTTSCKDHRENLQCAATVHIQEN